MISTKRAVNLFKIAMRTAILSFVGIGFVGLVLTYFAEIDDISAFPVVMKAGMFIAMAISFFLILILGLIVIGSSVMAVVWFLEWIFK